MFLNNVKKKTLLQSAIKKIVYTKKYLLCERKFLYGLLLDTYGVFCFEGLILTIKFD